MTEMPPARPSEPRTAPPAPAPAHGDGPTGPSTPTGHTALRERLADALTREHYRRARERIEASPEDHCAAFADAVMPVVEAETTALRQRIEEVEDQRDQALAWQDTAERERDEERAIRQQTEEALAIAHDTSNRSERARQAAERAIADHRRGRLAAEAAVRRARELARNRIAVPTDVLREALTIEQPEEP